MKIVITVLLCYATISSSFDLYDVMDDARSAIESFYDPFYVQPEVRAKRAETTTELPTTKTSVMEEKRIVLPKFTWETDDTTAPATEAMAEAMTTDVGTVPNTAGPTMMVVLPKSTTTSARRSSRIKTRRIRTGTASWDTRSRTRSGRTFRRSLKFDPGYGVAALAFSPRYRRYRRREGSGMWGSIGARSRGFRPRTKTRPKSRYIRTMLLKPVGHVRKLALKIRPRPVPHMGKHSLKIRPRPVARVRKLALKPKPTRTATKKSRPAPTKRVSLNKFAEAIEDIEKALADAQNAGARVKHDERRLSKLKDLIKTAIEKRSYRFARKAIGEAMFTIRKINEQRKTGRGRRNTVLSSKGFLGSVRKTIGVSAFNDLLAMQGQVTLMFAIDDTGSMSEEIAAAKKIAKSIVDQQRIEPVDYILSPFNDPGTGPVTYCSETEKDRFVKAIDSLRPHRGGDCPELTFKGMIDAIDEGPQLDSPLYVFTDAGPKDATDENVIALREIAQVQGLVINFFLQTTSGCASTAYISSFHEIAQATTGQVFELKDAKELEKLQGLTATSLGGTAVVADAIHQPSRRKRSLSKTSKTYSIPIDDSIDTLVISVTADQNIAGGNGVSLTSPTGSIAGVTTNHLDQGTVYQISKPSVGIWNLGIKTDSGVNYDFFAKGSSADNIDFEYYFVRTTSRRGVDSTVPIPAPLSGKEAEAILTLGGVAKVNHQTLKAEIVTLEGEIIQTSKPVSLTSKDKKGIRHSFKFFPPNQIFKIKIKGRTKKGNSFERICHNPIKPETLLVKVVFARNDYTMTQGGSGYVLFMIENFGDDEVVDINSFGSLGTVERQSRKISRVRKGRRTSFSVSFRGNTKATKGVTVTIVVSVKGRKSGSKSVMSVPLLVV